MHWSRRAYPRSSTQRSVLPCSASASAESRGSSTPTEPEVMTMSPVACSWLSAIMLPAEKYFVVDRRMSWLLRNASVRFIHE